MSDTNDREKLEAEQAAQEPAPEGRPAAQEQVAGSAPDTQEGKQAQEPQKAWEPEVTAEQFPRLDPEDLPPEAQGAIPDIPMEDEELPSLEEDKPEFKGKLYNFVAKMDDKQFRRAQMIFGIVLGALAALAMLIHIPNDDGGTSMWNFVIALVLVMWVPRVVERKIEQRIPLAQKWMLIVFVLGFGVSIAINAAQGYYTAQHAVPSPSPSVAPSVSPTPQP